MVIETSFHRHRTQINVYTLVLVSYMLPCILYYVIQNIVMTISALIALINAPMTMSIYIHRIFSIVTIIYHLKLGYA